MMRVEKHDPACEAGLCSREALSRALAEWRLAQELFDSAEDTTVMELAAIRLDAAHRRFGCLAAGYKEDTV